MIKLSLRSLLSASLTRLWREAAISHAIYGVVRRNILLKGRFNALLQGLEP